MLFFVLFWILFGIFEENQKAKFQNRIRFSCWKWEEKINWKRRAFRIEQPWKKGYFSFFIKIWIFFRNIKFQFQFQFKINFNSISIFNQFIEFQFFYFLKYIETSVSSHSQKPRRTFVQISNRHSKVLNEFQFKSKSKSNSKFKKFHQNKNIKLNTI